MAVTDIPTVTLIEQQAYHHVPPQRDYQRELTSNKYAHYFVLSHNPTTTVIGVAGFWLLGDAAHITTIAIQSNFKQKGLGAWLLGHLIRQAEVVQADVVTLEVRASNQPAIQLYQTYQFATVGQRPNYYDNHETALILTTPSITSTDYQVMLNAKEELFNQRFQSD